MLTSAANITPIKASPKQQPFHITEHYENQQCHPSFIVGKYNAAGGISEGRDG